MRGGAQFTGGMRILNNFYEFPRIKSPSQSRNDFDIANFPYLTLFVPVDLTEIALHRVVVMRGNSRAGGDPYERVSVRAVRGENRLEGAQ